MKNSYYMHTIIASTVQISACVRKTKWMDHRTNTDHCMDWHFAGESKSKQFMLQTTAKPKSMDHRTNTDHCMDWHFAGESKSKQFMLQTTAKPKSMTKHHTSAAQRFSHTKQDTSKNSANKTTTTITIPNVNHKYFQHPLQ